jgi:hypothetical protein
MGAEVVNASRSSMALQHTVCAAWIESSSACLQILQKYHREATKG